MDGDRLALVPLAEAGPDHGEAVPARHRRTTGRCSRSTSTRRAPGGARPPPLIAAGGAARQRRRAPPAPADGPAAGRAARGGRGAPAGRGRAASPTSPRCSTGTAGTRSAPPAARRRTSTEGGLVRLCPRCGDDHHPRTDPVVIMLVDGRRARPARPRARAGRRAATRRSPASSSRGRASRRRSRARSPRRAASTVGPPRYVASQPWPFPSSLMLGFDRAVGRGRAARRWRTRSRTCAGSAGPRWPPRPPSDVDGWGGGPTRGPGRDRAAAAAAPRHRAAADRALARRGLAQAIAAAAQAAAAAATWRSSVPQQPPITVTLREQRRAARRSSAPSSAGSPSSSSVGLVELRVAPRRGVRRAGPRSARASSPPAASDGGEVRRVRAVDHVVGDRPERLGVDLLDRVAERLAARQPPVGLDGERDRPPGCPAASAARAIADRLVGVGHRDRRDHVGAGGGERGHLRRRGRPAPRRASSATSGDVAVAARADDAVDQDRGRRRPARRRAARARTRRRRG